VAETSRIIRFDNIEKDLKHPPLPVVVRSDFPHDEFHGWHYIAIGPDGWLYVPVGSPCDTCLMKDPIHYSITRMTLDGKKREIFASGVRNSVGFDWHPGTKELWFTDNGRDYMGDDLPSDELNRAASPGLHFGFPYCHQGDLPDPEFGQGIDCATDKRYTPPAAKLGAHMAPLGMKFYTGAMFPENFRRQIFIAEHGSSDRTKKVGYRIISVTLDGSGHVVSQQPFIEGWLTGEEFWGRPVDVLVMPDGSLLISDDSLGVIYRVSYHS
jgi:glucose/arabinose dehydrogenase